MLKQILLKNFKSYRDQALPLAPLTLMIGANASGKSNAIEAFRLLSWFSTGERLAVMQQRMDDASDGLRGRALHLGYFGATQFSLGCELNEDDFVADQQAFDEKWHRAKSGIEQDMLESEMLPSYLWTRLDVTLSLNGGSLHLLQESISSPTQSKPLYAITKPAPITFSDIGVEYNNFDEGAEDLPQVTCTNQMALMSQLNTHVAFYKSHETAQYEIPQAIRYFCHFLTQTQFLSFEPTLMRADSYPDTNLRSNGANLAGVLYTLWQQDLNKNAILEFIRSVPENNVSDVRFFPDRRGLVSFELVEKEIDKVTIDLEKKLPKVDLGRLLDGEVFHSVEHFKKMPETISNKVSDYWQSTVSLENDGVTITPRGCPAELLSDGTLRVLAIAAAVLSAPVGSTVVIEEIDNGVHPSRARHLLTTMQKYATQRNVHLLLTTHNPALMDALPDTALGDVVFCYRDPQQGDSRLVKLGDLPDYVELIVRGTLGDLVTGGIVDRFVKCPTTPETQKQKALDWLARLQQDDAA
jgi:predicted ATPase